jgi:23S rRNA (guanosine2251-2'-O)-methyltransferase
MPQFQIRQCPVCRFRFPVVAGSGEGVVCPRCRGVTELAGEAYEGHEVKAEAVARREGGEGLTAVSHTPIIHALLDNIRSIYNVGSLFRTADGAGISHLHLCGITATPEHPKVAKTALGADQAVAWSYYPNGPDAAVALKQQGFRLWAMEGGPRAVSLLEALPELAGPPILLIAGNEIAGVDPAILDQCDRVFFLPMLGVKGSLNVATAFGIAAYFLRFGQAGSRG